MRAPSWRSRATTPRSLEKRIREGGVRLLAVLGHVSACMVGTRLTSTYPGCYRKLNSERLYLVTKDYTLYSTKQRNSKVNQVGNAVLEKDQGVR